MIRTGASAFAKELLPPAATFYKREFSRLGRPSRGRVLVACCFHKDKTPSLSLNLQTGSFNCFGCGARGGDIVDFLMKRDHLSFKAAAQSLGAWRNITPEERKELDRRRAEREQRAQAEQAAQHDRRRKRIEVRDWLHWLERVHRQASKRLTQIKRGDPEKCQNETETLWELMAGSIDDVRIAAAQYADLAGIGDAING